MPQCYNIQDILNNLGFLLARLYLNLLFDEKNEKRVRALGTQLQSGSGAYDHAYDETMKRIKQQSSFSQDLAKRILGWVTFSARPITAVELQDAIAVEIGQPLFDETNITDIEEMISVYSGLVVIEENSNLTKLVHFTAQEYLKRTRNSWFTGVYHFLTDTCLTYLSFDNFDDSSLTQVDSQVQREGYSFYQYSAHEIGTHLRQSLGGVSLLLAFITDNAKVSRCMREIFGLSGTDCSFTGLHLASVFGLEHIVEESSHTKCNFNVWDYLGRTPLTWAAGSGNERVVKLLLHRGSNPNSVTKEGFTPLFYASAYGHVTVVRLLIDAGANVKFENKSHETPIFFAAKGGCEVRLGHRLLFKMGDHASVIKLLLDAGADLEQKNDLHVTPLCAAAENGNEKAVQLLLERNARINSNVRIQQEITARPLAAAALKGHIKITKLLLESGADTPFQRRDTNVPPSHYALSCLPKSVTDEDEISFAAKLKESGIPSFEDEFKRLPLHWAASRGDSALVQRILRAECNPNPKDVFSRTPLFAAVCMESVHVVKLLLDHPDINAQVEDKLGFTPLKESYRRQTSTPQRGNNAGTWGKITNLLRSKVGLHEECLQDIFKDTSHAFRPNRVNILSFARYPQPQVAFYKRCDVCLDMQARISDIQECKSCNMITKKNGTPGGSVLYCGSCIQGVKSCPLCGQPLMSECIFFRFLYILVLEC